MKIFVVLNLLLLLGLSQAQLKTQEDNGLVSGIEEEINQAMHKPRKALKRIVRDTFMGLGQALPSLQSKIIDNCKSNGADTDDLEDVYSDLKTCFRKKQIFITPKAEFLSNIDQCAAEAVKQTKNCLPEEKKYFPEFLLALTKSVITFLYDDYDVLRVDLAVCLSSMNAYSARLNYINCLTRTSKQTQDTDEIPSSKASFCQKFLPASYCFTDMIRDSCDDTTNLQKFRKDYINAMKQPCN